jgi:hypothetical protein
MSEISGAPAAAATAGSLYAVRSRPGLRASKRTRRAAEAEVGDGEGGGASGAGTSTARGTGKRARREE